MLKVSGFYFFNPDIVYNSLPPGETPPCRHIGVHVKQTDESTTIKFSLIFLSDNLPVKAQSLLVLVMGGIYFKSSFLLLSTLKLYVDPGLLWGAPACWPNRSHTGWLWWPETTNFTSHSPCSRCEKTHLPFLTSLSFPPWADQTPLEADSVSG